MRTDERFNQLAFTTIVMCIIYLHLMQTTLKWSLLKCTSQHLPRAHKMTVQELLIRSDAPVGASARTRGLRRRCCDAGCQIYTIRFSELIRRLELGPQGVVPLCWVLLSSCFVFLIPPTAASTPQPSCHATLQFVSRDEQYCRAYAWRVL
jgi:hypothetical protein